jgi:hypothetical protein
LGSLAGDLFFWDFVISSDIMQIAAQSHIDIENSHDLNLYTGACLTVRFDFQKVRENGLPEMLVQ